MPIEWDTRRAIVAVERPAVITTWYLIYDDNTRYTDLGSGLYDSCINMNRKLRGYVGGS